MAGLLYGHALSAPFTHDDFATVGGRGTQLDHAAALAALGQEYLHQPRRFLTNLSFLADLGANASRERMRAENVGLHALAALGLLALLALLLRRQFPELARRRRLTLATLGALLFLAHPLATQAVTYVSQRYTSMGGALCVWALTLGFLARDRWETGQPWRQPAVWGPWSAGLLLAWAAGFCKEFPILLPVAALLGAALFFTPSRLSRWARLGAWLPFALAAAVLLLLYLPGGPGDHSESAGQGLTAALPDWSLDSPVTRAAYFWTQLEVIPRIYLRLALWPVGLSIDHGFTLRESPANAATIAGALVLAGLLALVLWQWRRRPLLSFGIAWFLLWLVPSSSLVPNTEIVAEQRAYVSLMGLPLALLAFARNGSLRAWLGGGAVLLVALGTLTWQRNEVWRSERTLWGDAARLAPNRPRPYVYLGDEAWFRQPPDLAAAARHYEQFLQLNQSYAPVFFRLGTVYSRQARYREAAVVLEQGLALERDNAAGWELLLDAYARLGNDGNLANCAQRWLAACPEDWRPAARLAQVFAERRAWKAAATAYARATDKPEAPPEVYLAGGEAWRQAGEPAAALDTYRRLQRRYPQAGAVACVRSAEIRLQQNQPAEAAAALRQAETLAPNEPAVPLLLAEALLRQGDYAGAIGACDRATVLGAHPPAALLERLAPHR